MLGIGSRIKHAAYGMGVVIRVHTAAYDVCFTQFGIKPMGKTATNFDIVEAIAPEESVTFTKAEKGLERVLKAFLGFNPDTVALGDKWIDGKMILQPADSGLKNKEIPIDAFFHKIVMMRDRMRVLEQQINANKKLSDEEKVNLQQYITRCYGSMTTFNVLFDNKDDYFKGESKR